MKAIKVHNLPKIDNQFHKIELSYIHRQKQPNKLIKTKDMLLF